MFKFQYVVVVVLLPVVLLLVVVVLLEQYPGYSQEMVNLFLCKGFDF
jgi:hypothetical protein